MDPLFCLLLGLPVAIVFGLKFYIGKGAPNPCANRLDGKTVLITGASSGIGKAVATECAARGAKVVLGCRDTAKAEGTVALIRRKTANEEVFFVQLDLASLQSVRDFVKYYLTNYSSLDILVNNAAYMGPKSMTMDGYERTFQVNYLSHFLLSNLLVEMSKPSAAVPLRIINVASDSYLKGKIDFEDLSCKNKTYDSYTAYGTSKLAILLFTTELNYKFADVGAMSVAVHPGPVSTNLLRNWPGRMGSVLRAAARVLFRSAEDGAESVIYCATVDDLGVVAGKCVYDCQVMPLVPKARDYRCAERLWSVSASLTDLDNKLAAPRVLGGEAYSCIS